MRNSLRLSLACSIAILSVGCASTTIYPHADGNYSLVTTSSQQGYAEKDAAKKAEEYCAKMGKRYFVVDHKTAYHGIEKDKAAMINLAGAVFGGGRQAGSNDDYEVTMKFKCQ